MEDLTRVQDDQSADTRDASTRAAGNARGARRLGHGKSASRAAWLILAGVLLSALITMNRGLRTDRIDEARIWAPPSLSCFTGYDESGRCVAWNLAGGVHSFLVPGLLAALIVGAGGTVFGVLEGFAGGGIGRLSRRLMVTLEALPRLVMLVMAFSLSGYSMIVVGVVLGVLGIPALAAEVAMRFRKLEQADYFQSSLAHGLRTSRIVLHHGLWLSSAGDIMRLMVLSFGQMMVADTTLTYVLDKNLSGTELSWGYQLRMSLECLYDSLWAFEDWLQKGETLVPWSRGWTQFLAIMLAVLGVLWATHTIGETLARRMERRL